MQSQHCKVCHISQRETAFPSIVSLCYPDKRICFSCYTASDRLIPQPPSARRPLPKPKIPTHICKKCTVREIRRMSTLLCLECREKYDERIRRRKKLVSERQRYYARTFLNQKGRCAICRHKETFRTPSGRIRRLAIDHDHMTGKRRGLLCMRCNTVLGAVKDNMRWLKIAYMYLKRASESEK